jgi:nucleotide-binding universal stress UspA family protein
MSAQVTERANRMVVGLDGSPSSLAALEWVAGLAESTDATVEVVTAWEWPKGLATMSMVPGDYDPEDDAEAMVTGAVREVRRRHPEIEFVPVVVEGHPAPILVEASKGADLLAIGNRGHGEVAGVLIGSVSGHCAAHAHSPVLVIRDRDRT